MGGARSTRHLSYVLHQQETFSSGGGFVMVHCCRPDSVDLAQSCHAVQKAS